jgi:deazaflavin-dependent oxidoreductase (nitroreductase family)
MTAISRVPRVVPLLNKIAKPLLAAGVPMGYNGLLTVPGRKSGVPRATPLAIIDVSGRRWIWSPWGEVHWVHNLRAAGRATIAVRGHEEQVRAVELDTAERLGFFRDVFAPLVRSMRFGVTFVRLLDGVDVNDPLGASEGRVVFELHPIGRAPSMSASDGPG